MSIKTKYDIGESVWFIRNNKVQNCNVLGIHFRMGQCKDSSGAMSDIGTWIRYILGPTWELDEELLFPTKQELLESL